MSIKSINFHSIFPVDSSKRSPAGGEQDGQAAQREDMVTMVAVSLAVLIVAIVAVLIGMT